EYPCLNQCPPVKIIAVHVVPRRADVQAIYRSLIYLFGDFPPDAIKVPMCFESQFDSTFMPDTFTHLLFGQSSGQTGNSLAFPDELYVFIIIRLRTGNLIQRLSAIQVQSTQPEKYPGQR